MPETVEDAVTRVLLDPTRKLVETIADFLAARVRTLDGAPSLAHLWVVVPTAQSGRRLRLALARRFPEGLVSPRVTLPAHLVEASEEVAVAGRTDEILAFHEAGRGTFGLEVAAQLSDIRAILGADALTFADVAERVDAILANDEAADFEIARWKDLAELETRYFAALARRGRADRIVALRAALAAAVPPRGVEEIVLAGVLDPIPVMRRALAALKRPVTDLRPAPVAEMPLSRAQVTAFGTAARECEQVAETVAGVKADEALPALCLADSEMFTDLQSALQARGLAVHNPSATRLVTSSLGHLAAQVAALARTRSYSVFSTFIRGGDVRRWLGAELNLGVADYTAALSALDERQAELLPEKMDDIGPKTTGDLRRIYDAVDRTLREKGLRETLQAVFAGVTLDEREADAREFAAAAEALNGLVDECFGASVPSALAMELFALRLEESVYALEPDEGETVLTDGWLEVPFLEADELLVAGFAEGRVPESVVGHAYLPDRLRRGLGLTDNAARAARDRDILAQALACRKPEAVRLSFHNLDAKGDVMKPSRLLFETRDDVELAARARLWYGLRAGTGESRAHDLPAAWRLKLPVPPAHAELVHLSPTALDRYLKCPFHYYVASREILGDKRMDDRAEELQAWEFGNFAHEALEAWARSPLRDSEDAEAIATFLEGEVDRQLTERFGAAVPSIVALQGESIKRRLRHFAPIQVARHAAGWKVVAAEKEDLYVTYGHTRFKGKSDRIDYNEKTGAWCVIDYKTWDSADRAKAYDAKKGEWRSLQLPIYCAMLDALAEEPFKAATRENISACYCVLGKTVDQVVYSEAITGALVPEAEKLIRRLVARIEDGLFWPPAKDSDWQYDFKDWFSPRPEETVDPAWIADQERRVAAVAAREEGEAAGKEASK